MTDARLIRTVAAVIRDAAGRVLLVRKRGTTAFMQPGGKIEANEQPVHALARELEEELGLVIDPAHATFLGQFSAPAANEPGFTVQAELFQVRIDVPVTPAAEIEEVIAFAPHLHFQDFCPDPGNPFFRFRPGCG